MINHNHPEVLLKYIAVERTILPVIETAQRVMPIQIIHLSGQSNMYTDHVIHSIWKSNMPCNPLPGWQDRLFQGPTRIIAEHRRRISNTPSIPFNIKLPTRNNQHNYSNNSSLARMSTWLWLTRSFFSTQIHHSHPWNPITSIPPSRHIFGWLKTYCILFGDEHQFTIYFGLPQYNSPGFWPCLSHRRCTPRQRYRERIRPPRGSPQRLPIFQDLWIWICPHPAILANLYREKMILIINPWFF